MHIREALLRLDQATRGMLDCLLGPGGTLEALSTALSRVDGHEDAQARVLHVHERAGLPPLLAGSVAPPDAPSADAPSADAPSADYSLRPGGEGSKEGSKDETREGEGSIVRGSEPDGRGDATARIASIHEQQKVIGTRILGLAEDGLASAFEGARDLTAECSRVLHDVCCCLAEVGRFVESMPSRRTHPVAGVSLKRSRPQASR